MTKTELQTEIDQNLEFFLEKLPKLLKEHRNRYVLLQHKSIVGIFDTIRDAQTTGDKLFTDKLYSIQMVSDVAMDLGFLLACRSPGVGTTTSKYSWTS